MFLNRFRLIILSCLILLVCLFAGRGSQAQDTVQDETPTRMSLYLWLDTTGGAVVGVPAEDTGEGIKLSKVPFQQALGGPITPFRPTEYIISPRDWESLGRCNGVLRLQGGLRKLRVNPKPLIILLRAHKIRWLSIIIQQQPMPYSQATGIRLKFSRATKEAFYSRTIDLGRAQEIPQPIVLTYGYRPGQVAGIVLPLLLILLAPLALTLWMRAQALIAEERAAKAGKTVDPAAVWFGYGHYLQSLSIGIWVVWSTVLIAVQARAFLTFMIGQSWVMHSGLPIVLIYLPALVIIACYGLSYPVFARVRSLEYTKADLLRQAAWGQSRLLPLLCLLNGLTEYSYDQRLGMAWFAGAILTNILTAQGAMKALGSAPEALTTGELRDRVFALATAAHVPLRQVYVIRAGKGRLANAFASVGNNVLLTDFLLERLNKREVDAVVGHELTHLKRRHPQALQVVFLFIFIAAGILAGYTEWWTSLSSLSGAAYAAMALTGLLLSYALARRFEWAADAGAVTLTGDGEAMISGLAKISHLNQTPLHWSKWHEKWLTHPPTIHRMQRIGQTVGLSQQRVEALAQPEKVLPEGVLSEEDLPKDLNSNEHSGSDDAFYTLAARKPETLIFSTRRKVNLLQEVFWGSVLLTPGLAILAALAARSGHCPAPLQWLLLLLGLVLAFTVPRFLQDSLQRPWFARMERLLRQKLEAEGKLAPGERADFVTYSPHAFPRIYEGFYDWDIGFLIIGPDQMRYIGEKARFALAAWQIIRVEQREDTPRNWKRWSRLYIYWHDAPEGSAQGQNIQEQDIQEQDFQEHNLHGLNVCPGAATSVRQSRQNANEVLHRIQAWQARSMSAAPAIPEAPDSISQAPDSIPPSLLSLEPPSDEEVTALSPHGLITFLSFLHALIVQVGLAAGLSLLVGLAFDLNPASDLNLVAHGKWPSGLCGWYVLFVTFSALVIQCFPIWRYRDQKR